MSLKSSPPPNNNNDNNNFNRDYSVTVQISTGHIACMNGMKAKSKSDFCNSIFIMKSYNKYREEKKIKIYKNN